MELQNQLHVEGGGFLCSEDDRHAGGRILFNTCPPLQLDGNSNPFCNYWMSSYSGSYAEDARVRLETLKSGAGSPSPSSSMNGPMYSYDYSKDIWELGINELSALDSVDLIDVHELEENGESWLYVPPRSIPYEENTESALGWARHVLDNHSPEMEEACRKLMNRLNFKGSSENRCHALQQNTFSFDSPVSQSTFQSTAPYNSFDCSDQGLSPESNHRMQNITDVYDLARLQEASLRQGYVYPSRSTESPLMQPPCSHATAANSYHIIHGKGTKDSSSRSYVQQAATIEKKCLSPKVTRLHQFKELKRAQSQGSSSRSSSPLRTSLRSLQAVRSSRSLDIDDYHLYQILSPRTSASPTKADCRTSTGSKQNQCPDVPSQCTAIKRCQRSHSLSPCRIPQPPLSPQDSAWLRKGRKEH